MTMSESEIAAQANVSTVNVKGESPAGGKVLVTGAAGFIGSALALCLLERGDKNGAWNAATDMVIELTGVNTAEAAGFTAANFVFAA